MSRSAMQVLPLLLCVIDFALLALAMERHQEALFGRVLSQATTRVLRVFGWLGLVAALAWIVALQGWALGLTRFSGMTSLAAGVVFGALIVYERRRGGRRDVGG